MQDVDGIAHVERFTQPARTRRPRVQVEPRALVACSERLHWIVGDRERRRNIGQRSSVRSPEPQLAVGLSVHLIALLVDGPALGPVTEVVPLAERQCTAREAAAAIAMV